jgi:AraC-like DNA-binding protein
LQEYVKKLGFQNFNSLLNHFRVEEAARKLGDPEFDHFTIEAIAKESGFGSRSSFYQVFEIFKGIKPNIYRSRINQQED